MDPDRDLRPLILFFLIVAIILFVGLFTPVRDRLQYHVDDWKSRLYYMKNKPEEQLFVPQEQIAASSTPTEAPTETPEILLTDIPVIVTPEATEVPTQTPEPTETPEPLPASWNIEGVRYEDQHGIWNYCAPTNLSMAMTYWGWIGDRTSIGPKVKPFNKDKNVMFYELQEYVEEYSELRSVLRPGGTDELLKRLLVNGFPVLVEKGSFMQEVSGKLSWMGHYNVITGYDDEAEEWIVQDSYYTPNYKVSYEVFAEEWKGFNYQFMLVYPGSEEARVYEILGPYTNGNWANRNAMQTAERLIEEAQTTEEYFYAYFNRGTCQTALSDYYGAAQSYDMAFTYYADIETSRRPYRIVWYQTGPYTAYYYCGRYYDILSLAETTLASTAEPYLEETHYWRAKAYEALGEIEKARDDLNTCLELHKGFEACEQLLYDLGGPDEE